MCSVGVLVFRMGGGIRVIVFLFGVYGCYDVCV